MKKTIFLFVIMILCATALSVFADGSCGPNAAWTLSEDGVMTISGIGPMEEFKYTSDVPWKDEKDLITSVVVQEGITSIGQNSFYWCKNLTTVTLPQSLTTIGKSAFQSSSKLVSINMPDSITTIGKEAFQGCYGLTSIHIPNQLETIDNYTFYGCDKLVSVELPETLKYIGDLAFAGCDSLTEIVIPASVTFISKDRAFNDCERLQRITIADGNPNYVSVDGVLYDKGMTTLLYHPAGHLNGSYVVPDGITSINDYAFYENSNLLSVTIPSSVMSIGEYAFGYCSKLNAINFSEGLQSIGSYAFYGDYALTSITFPASMMSLGNDPFDGCSSLNSINVAAGSSYFTSSDGILFNADQTILIAYPRSINKTSYAVPDGVEKIGDYAFLNNDNLVTVTFPESLTSIGKNAFAYSKKLTNPTFPSNLITIEDRAFNSCDGLTNVIIPESVSTIGSSAFSWCDNLLSATILNPNAALDKWGVFDYGNDAFTLIGYEGSTAEEHAANENIPFTVYVPEEIETELTTEPASEGEICINLSAMELADLLALQQQILMEIAGR